MVNDTELNDNSMFFRHVSSRWLTLGPAIDRIIKQWSKVKTYFLEVLPSKSEYKYTLPKNKRYQRIVGYMKDKETEKGWQTGKPSGH